MARVTVDDKKARLAMKRMFDRAEDFKPIFRWARNELARANRRNFASSGAASGKPWMPLDDEYARWKLAHGGPRPLLVFSGKLRADLSSLRGAPNEIDKTSAVFGTNIKYAQFHQNGTWKMPARKIVFVPELFAQTMGIKTLDYVVNGNISLSGTILKGLF